MLAAWLLLIAVVARLPSCSWESGGAVTVAMNITGFVSPCATDSNSPEKVRSHIRVRWGGCLLLFPGNKSLQVRPRTWGRKIDRYRAFGGRENKRPDSEAAAVMEAEETVTVVGAAAVRVGKVD